MIHPIVPAAAGLQHDVLGIRHLNKVLPDGGHGLIMEMIVSPGQGAPEHAHAVDAEAFYILNGELVVEQNGATSTLRRGDMCFLPPGQFHAFRNESAHEARAIVVATPGMDAFAFFAEIDAAGRAGPLALGAVVAIGETHGLAFAA